ncbi:MAG: MOSC domain-containing protein [Proteobacteria bacterium]|nr:MOSC domain-containing protein [Pseudomonadota bacterium]
MKGVVLSINISEKKSIRKKPVDSAVFVEDKGIEGDAHAEGGIRQVSLLANESIEKMRKAGLDVKAGDFAENITTEGVNLIELPIGKRIKIGDVILEVTQHGKVCHTKCNIFKTVGDCVMPREGIFCKIVKGGVIRKGQTIEVIEK